MNNFEDMLEEVKENDLLVVLDNLEEQIKMADKINKEYSELKSKIKDSMYKIAVDHELGQVKWITPKGIKITFSKGVPEELEKEVYKELDTELLKEKYPSVYEDCLAEKERLITVKNASNDRLVVTMPKE